MTDVPLARWVHHDPALPLHLEEALSRARALDWSSGPEARRVAELRALIADTAYLCAKLAGTTSRVTGADGTQTLYIDPRPALDAPPLRREAAGRLYRTLELLARGAQTSGDWETWAQGPSPETGALPAVAIVAIVVVAGAALAYCGHEAAKVVDRQLSRSEDSARLVQSHAAALEVIDAHTEREEKAGKTLPLDEASRAVLDALSRVQTRIAERVPPAYGGDLLPTSTDSTWDFSTGAIVGLLAAGGLWVLSKTGVI